MVDLKKFKKISILRGGISDESEISNTTSIKNNEGWTLNGEKLFVNDANSADYFIVAASTENQEGTSLFLVPKDTEGIEIQKMESIGGEKIYKVNFQEIKLESSQIIGEEGEGWNTLQKVLIMEPQVSLQKCLELQLKLWI